MICPICRADNPGGRLSCFKCGMVLPQYEAQEDDQQDSGLSIVLDEHTEVDDLVQPNDCVYLIELEALRDSLLNNDISTDEAYTELDRIQKESQYILSLIESFTPEEKEWIKDGLLNIQSAYDTFQDAFGRVYNYLDTADEGALEDGVKTARGASKMLLEGIHMSQKELDRIEEEIEGEKAASET